MEKEKIKEEDTIIADALESDIDEVLANNSKISLLYRTKYKDQDLLYETSYYEKLIDIFAKISKQNKHYDIIIDADNRELLRKSNLLKNIPNNISLYIYSDSYLYDYQEYMKEEAILESLISKVRSANLSPFEKYIAAYNIDKKIKAYRINENNWQEHCYLRYILNNEYIACGGFSNLFVELLERLDIPATFSAPFVDNSYDEGFTKEEKPITYDEHARCLVKIDDDKYNIHGIYLSDPTWDNNLENDSYQFAIMTFDRLKEAKYLEKLTDKDLLLDFHNLDDFKKKTEYFMKHHIETHKAEDKRHPRRTDYHYVIDSMWDYYITMEGSLINIDVRKYRYFKEIINNIPDTIYKKVLAGASPLDANLEVFNKILTEYADYIIPLVNKEIPMDVILKAAATVKKNAYDIPLDEIASWYEETEKFNREMAPVAFPYKYDPSNKTEAYLEDRIPSESNKNSR